MQNYAWHKSLSRVDSVGMCLVLDVNGIKKYPNWFQLECVLY